MLASWADDGTRVWALDIDDLLEIARRNVTRSLSDEECRRYLHVAACSDAWAFEDGVDRLRGQHLVKGADGTQRHSAALL